VVVVGAWEGKFFALKILLRSRLENRLCVFHRIWHADLGQLD